MPLVLMHRLRNRLAAVIVLTNAVGAAVIIVLLTFFLPVPDELDITLIKVSNLTAALIVIPLSALIGYLIGRSHGDDVIGSLTGTGELTEATRRQVLRFPQWLFALQARLWLAAVVVFVALNLPNSRVLALEIGATVGIGGLTTVAMAYLLAERIMRPAVALALADDAPRQYDVPGVGARALTAWALGTALPLLGVGLLNAAAFGNPIDSHDLARGALVLTGLSLIVGLGAIVIFARSVADPLKSLRDAMSEVSNGRLNIAVQVNDASEVGFLQAGFNRMVAGLREREQLHDLLGRHVGEDVARRALEHGVHLGGEEREAAALFVDIIGSTTLAAGVGPTEMVTRLNAFFEVVVDATAAHGGLVNKFEGDAALCIFGAPLELEDAAGAALAAAREMAARLTVEAPELGAGIGVSFGTVLAGNIGAADRLEYTVIGDPVNEAARLTELAKDQPGRVLASEAAVVRASEAEQALWKLTETVTLRGRTSPTRLAIPA